MGKTFAGHEFGKNFFKEGVWGNILSGKGNVIMEYGCPVDKAEKFSEEMNCRS